MIHEETAYTPPALNPLQAALCNALLTRQWPDQVELYGVCCSVLVDPWQEPFTPACGLDVGVRQDKWRVLFSSPALMGLHPAGKSLTGAAHLPEGLRLALFELSLGPLFGELADFLGLDTPLSVEAEALTPPEQYCCALPLRVHLPEESVALRLYLPQREDAESMLLRLAGRKSKKRALPRVLVPVGLEGGRMRLTAEQLRLLCRGDILLPESPPLFENEICLRMAPHVAVYCNVQGGQATVRDIVRIAEYATAAAPRPAENTMRRGTMDNVSSELANDALDGDAQDASLAPNTQVAKPAPQSLTSTEALLENLEVTVSFELERRLMSLAEIGALVPGYTFALPTTVKGAVNIMAQGQRLGTGRLVELEGTLGVQIVSLEQER